MKVIIKQLAKCTIEDFADAHDLTMLVNEVAANSGWRYYAKFERAEDKIDLSSGLLESSVGHGYTPDEAIRDYSRKISGRHLILNAASRKDRVEIACPIFIN